MASETGKLGRRATQYAGSFEKEAPRIADVFRREILPNELAVLNAAQETVPQFQALATQTALDLAPLQRQLLGDDVNQLSAIARQIDPEFFQTRSNLAAGLNEQINAGRTGLTGGERSEIERSINQSRAASGNAAAPSNAETVAAAGSFGQAARQKFAQALQQATAALPTLQTTLGQNPLAGRFNAVQPIGVPQPTFDAGQAGALQGFAQNLGAAQQIGIEADATSLSDFERVIGAMPSYS